MMVRHSIIQSIILIFCLVSTTAISDEREEIQRTFDIDPGATLEVHNTNGNVNISTWDESYVEMIAVKQTRYGREDIDRIKVEVENTRELVIIKAVFMKYDSNAEGSFFSRMFSRMGIRGPRGSVEFDIHLPEDVGFVLARTVNGSVTLEGVGDARAGTTNGSIWVENAHGEINATSTNGNISVNGSTFVSEARTTNGSIDVNIVSGSHDPVNLRTVNGTITLRVDQDLDAELNLRTVNGSVNASGFRIMVEKVSKKEVRGALGDGGMMIDASTVNGNVNLTER